MSNDLYPSLDLPAITNEQAVQLKRGTVVKTRVFYADSVPGSTATVVRHRKDRYGNVFLRCNFGKNLGGHSLLKWMHADAMCLSET